MSQFKRFNTSELIAYTKNFDWTRKVTELHVHHTWAPSHSDFNGTNYDSIQQGMKDYHVKNNGWSDIAQHLTLFPDGIWVAGRSFNVTPASILGWNEGAFCIEMIGNFDVGHDKLEGAQAEAMYEFCEYMVEKMKCTMKFHKDNPTANKTCPGSGINRDVFFDEVASFTEKKLIKQKIKKSAEEEEAKKRVEELKNIADKKHSMFKDMLNYEGEPHWSNEYVNFLVHKKIISGFKKSDGTYIFKPDETITRAEIATLLAKTYQSIEEMVKAEINKNKL